MLLVLGSAIVSILLFSQISESSSLKTMYVAHLDTQAASLKEFAKKLKSNRSEICPLYKSNDASGCFKSYLQTTSITSSTQFVMLVALVPAAGLLDKEAGFAQSTLPIMSADNLITMIERADLGHFYLSTLKPQNDKDKRELSSLMKTEEDLMKKAIERITPFIEKSISSDGKSRDTASVEAWKNQTVAKLKERHAKNKIRTWRFPNN